MYRESLRSAADDRCTKLEFDRNRLRWNIQRDHDLRFEATEAAADLALLMAGIEETIRNSDAEDRQLRLYGYRVEVDA